MSEARSRRLTVDENLRLGPGDPVRAFELFPELRDHRRRRAGLLSGGQQKMLALALALSGRPKVLLADELSLGLAPRLVDRLLDVVRAAAGDGVGSSWSSSTRTKRSTSPTTSCSWLTARSR